MKTLALTSLLPLGAVLASLACTSAPTQEAPEPAEAAVRKGVNEPTSQPDRPRTTPVNTITPEEMSEALRLPLR